MYRRKEGGENAGTIIRKNDYFLHQIPFFQCFDTPYQGQ
jgi:hypothetical protein